MFRTYDSYLLPRYTRTKSSSNVAQYYDGLDGFDSGSEELSRKFVERFQNAQARDDSSSSAEDSSDNDESASSSDEESIDPAATTLREQLSALLKQFPAHTVYLKAAAYQAEIYQPSQSFAYDPQISSFFRVMDDIDKNKLPAEIAKFCKDLQTYSEDCNRMKNALPFSK